MKKKKALYENPHISNSDEYFSAIAADKDVSYQDSAEKGKIKASGELFSQITDDELIPQASSDEPKQDDTLFVSNISEADEEKPAEPHQEEKTVHCKVCGSENPDTFSECVFCGAALK